MKGVKTKTEYQYEFEQKFGEFKELLKGKTIYQYDTNGNKVKSSQYGSDGSLKYKDIFTYDSKNRIIESVKYKIESKFGEIQEVLTDHTTYEYDEY